MRRGVPSWARDARARAAPERAPGASSPATARTVKALLCSLAALLGAASCSSDTASITPLHWQKVESSTTGLDGSVLGLDPVSGSFDEIGNFTVSAFKDGGVTFLYYGGADATGDCPGINNAHWRIGLATSTDGVNFTRVQGPGARGEILDNGASGAFDSYLTYRPYVLKDGAVWRMWYNGSDRPFNDCHAAPGPSQLADDRRIGYAESPDGVHFTKAYDGLGPGGSVLPLGGAGEIDAQQVGYVWVLRDGAGYKMYYSANDVTNTWRVALAVSSDARTWTKLRGKNADGSVLDIGGAGDFDVACAYQPTVVKERVDLYRMWYRGCQASAPTVGGPSQGVIGYAESNDGITWVKVKAGGPLGEALSKGAAGQFDSGGLTTPSVLLDGSTWNMYYAGFNTTGRFLAGLARAPRQ
jgi:hypothetical protein